MCIFHSRQHRGSVAVELFKGNGLTILRRLQKPRKCNKAGEYNCLKCENDEKNILPSRFKYVHYLQGFIKWKKKRIIIMNTKRQGIS